MPQPGRPPILDDPFMQTSVLAMIAAGATRAAAARFVGVHVQTLRRRIRTDKTFAQRFLEAKAHYHGYTSGPPNRRAPAPRRPLPGQPAAAATSNHEPATSNHQLATASGPPDQSHRELFKQRLVEALQRAFDAYLRDRRRIPLSVLLALSSRQHERAGPFRSRHPRFPIPPVPPPN